MLDLSNCATGVPQVLNYPEKVKKGKVLSQPCQGFVSLLCIFSLCGFNCSCSPDTGLNMLKFRVLTCSLMSDSMLPLHLTSVIGTSYLIFPSFWAFLCRKEGYRGTICYLLFRLFFHSIWSKLSIWTRHFAKIYKKFTKQLMSVIRFWPAARNLLVAYVVVIVKTACNILNFMSADKNECFWKKKQYLLHNPSNFLFLELEKIANEYGCMIKKIPQSYVIWKTFRVQFDTRKLANLSEVAFFY